LFFLNNAFFLKRGKHFCPTQVNCTTKKRTLSYKEKTSTYPTNSLSYKEETIICPTERKTLLVLHNSFVSQRENHYLSFTVNLFNQSEKHYLSYNYKENNISFPTQLSCPKEKKTLLILHNAFVLQKGNFSCPTQFICPTVRNMLFPTQFICPTEENIVCPTQCICPA